MSAPRVFVSHSHQDDAITYKLVTDLKAAGSDVWVDISGIHDGDFLKRINDALAECEWLVLVLTPSAIASHYVEMEVNAAIQRVHQGFMRGVIPLLAKPCDLRVIPPLWATLHRYDAVGSYANALNGILQAIGLQDTEPPPPPPPPPITQDDWLTPLVEEGARLGILPGRGPYAGGISLDGPLYQRFHIALATVLRKRGLRYTPSTIDFASYCEFTTGYPGCLYVSAFIARDKARIALDISRRDDKRLFDALHLHKQEIEATFGCPLIWERMDSHIMSRIAAAYPGHASIHDESAKLKQIHDWMVDTMLRFQTTLSPWLDKLAASRRLANW